MKSNSEAVDLVVQVRERGEPTDLRRVRLGRNFDAIHQLESILLAE